MLTIDKIESLRAQILLASSAYYNDSESIISDEEFDALKDQLRLLSPNDPLLTQVGAPIKNTPWKKSTHKIPMNSLNKVNTEDEFRAWHKSCGGFNLTISEKLDGASLSLEYVDGNLVSGITRGDGIEGEQITRNVVKMKNVKQTLPETFTGSLRGEIILTQKDFQLLNEEAIKNDDKPFKTLRNAASGIARSFDGKYCKYLSVIYYGTTYKRSISAAGRFSYLKDVLGLPTAMVRNYASVDEAIKIYQDYEENIRVKLDWEIDGLVCEIFNDDKRNSLGELNGNPKGVVAFKFGAMKAETSLIDVEWQLGNSGRITPLAVFVPIKLAGATIQKASLHNLEMFEALHLGKGDTLLVSRRNDVIPYAESVVKHAYQTFGMFEIPKYCPECHAEIKKDGKYLVCPNSECSGKVSGNIAVWIKKLDLKGIADATIEILCAQEMVSEPADLYYLTAEQLQKFGGFGPRQSEKIIEILNSKKEVSLPEFIGGLNLPNFGRRMTETLVDAGYDELEKILALTEVELVSIKGIEIKTAQSFLKGIQSKMMIIIHLLRAGITIKAKEKIMSKSGSLTGKSFCFTGAIQRVEDGERMTRPKMQDLVRENGGEVSDSVKAGLTYLVQADPNSSSSKSVKAKKLGVEILSEADFFKMLGM